MSVLRTVLLGGLACAAVFAKRVKNGAAQSLNAEEKIASMRSECEVPKVAAVCNCDHQSRKGWQCSECKNPLYWGYGCDLDCSPTCGSQGCDFSGNCRNSGTKEKKSLCKRNSRIKRLGGSSGFFGGILGGGKSTQMFNERGECEACAREAYGVHCEERCADVSKNFAETAEGICTRGGHGYECKEGWYGEDCNSKCPASCKTCAMVDNLIAIEETLSSGKVEYYPAGACLDKCDADTWGPTCADKCSANCKKTSIPSCDKSTGDCFKCGEDSRRKISKPHQWWGGKCEKACGNGCVDFQCDKLSGHCEVGVVSGHCGRSGEFTCPERTLGRCDRYTCMPDACEDGYFPGNRKAGTEKGYCASCPSQCATALNVTEDGETFQVQTCEQDGSCRGCQDGYWGKSCEKSCSSGCAGKCDQWTGRCPCMPGLWGPECKSQCSSGCEGPCDPASGACPACKEGLTGKLCDQRCHKTCVACRQFAGTFMNLLGSPGTGAGHCLSCSPSLPSFFNRETQTCDCIDGAEISPVTGVCECTAPLESNMEAYFIERPKSCLKKCVEGYKVAYGNKQVNCFTGKVYKSIVRAEGSLEQGDCEEDEYAIPISGEDPLCVQHAFVRYILDE